MKKRRFWAGLLGAAVALGCAHGFKQKEGRKDLQLAYIDKVEAPTQAKAGEPVTVTVAGSWPTPAWEKADVETSRKNHVVTITIWGREARGGMAIQVLEPFEERLTLTGLTPGMWTIRVVGHGDTSRTAHVEIH